MHHFNGSRVCPWLLVRSQHYAAITLVSLDHVFITLQRQPMPMQQSSPSRWPLAAPHLQSVSGFAYCGRFIGMDSYRIRLS